MKHSNYVGCFILYNDKILLQFRGPNWKTFSNSWCTFGGKVEQNEELDQALKRELKEEISLDINCNEFSLMYENSFSEPQYQRSGTLYYFNCNLSEENVDSLKLLEGTGWGWFTFEEIMKLNTTPNLKEALEKSFKKN